MELWLVLQIKNETVGTQKEYTDEYNEYLNKLAQYEKEKEESGGLAWIGEPVEVANKYKTVPYKYQIPRVIEVSLTDPSEKYKDRLPNGDGWVYKQDVVWIDKINIDDKKITHNTLTFNVPEIS